MSHSHKHATATATASTSTTVSSFFLFPFFYALFTIFNLFLAKHLARPAEGNQKSSCRRYRRGFAILMRV